jgi:hypothetical protein
MKQVLLGAALCGAALALAGAANAANEQNYDFLYGSTDAFVLGPSGISTPTADYITKATNLYLEPFGYQGTPESTVALTTPNSYDFFPSVEEGQSILVKAIVDDYNAGEMDCNAAGVCSDPLTIFTYSQSSLVASLAQEQLTEAGVPTDALRFVMLGANTTVVPNDMYPTEIFNIQGDVFTDNSGTNWISLLLGQMSFQEFLTGLALHSVYLGLTADQIDSATSVVDGMTTINEIPTLTTSELLQALFNTYFG